MKKIILILLALVFSLPTFAYVTNTTKNGELEKLTYEIGYKLLNANKIPYNITFSINKRNMAYIEQVAVSWSERGINTLEDADVFMKEQSQKENSYASLKRIFGIKKERNAPIR
jgi:DnaD/phage-associated family protein